MDRLTETLLGVTDSEDDAADETATGAEDEGAFDPLALLDELDAPEDESDDDGDVDETDEDEDSEEPVDPAAALAEREARLAEREADLATKADEAERKTQLHLLKQAEDAWKAEEQQAFDWAVKHPKPQEAIVGIRQYYLGVIERNNKAAQVLLQQAYSGQYIDQVAGQSGLDADDKALLAAVDPKAAPGLAKALAAKNKRISDQIAAIQSDVKNLARGNQARRRQLTGADRPSSSRSPGGSGQRIQHGSDDDALLILQAQRALSARR